MSVEFISPTKHVQSCISSVIDRRLTNSIGGRRPGERGGALGGPCRLPLETAQGRELQAARVYSLYTLSE